ncbi:hypothetical protein GGI04_004517 [Coemansia thaxteri]|uniref:Major facilitator superfamily (MFS) profile domain-containing protein n=1 Tax=Coemansia thaxteri TaxID=2663907 RepID=A0A9W8EKD7_9FUNG|nr:hypothetical protein GGI04_004517 [Coemansia thaxteri]KAJ2005030.1 hypothetical protein H4R26_002182 [Coemansia thaxteri]KAJ2465110.1 hypothetical protein GGI02_004797 [Coemansia sp. RSA 2322]KAJ2485387.1 hypothetical protein EV174_001769 [Coemansia sp. RSA 2320]
MDTEKQCCDLERKADEPVATNAQRAATGCANFGEEPSLAPGFPSYTRYAVVASCFIIQGLSCGLVHAWGVQQEYLATNVYAGQPAKIKTLGYIGTLMYFGLYFWGMLAGWLAEVWSYRKLCFVGVAVMALGQLLASFCKEPWQLCLSEGLVFGLGVGLVFSPTSAAPARWFTKRRGLATGIAVAGVGVGGLVIAPLTEAIVRRAGVEWSLRISAMYILVLGAIACCFVRVPFQDRERTLRNFNWQAFGDRRFAIHVCMMLFVTAAYITPYAYLPQFWVAKGISAQTASVLIAVANVASSVGRVATGFAADYIGVLNSLVLCTGIAATSCFVVWPFATSVGAGTAMSLAYGFAAGGNWSLAPLAAGKLFGMDKLASNTGIFYTASAVGAWVGSPVAGAILAGPGHSTNYIQMSIYVGALWLAALTMALANRALYSQTLFSKV